MKEHYAHPVPVASQKAQSKASGTDDPPNQGKRVRGHPMMTTGIGWILQGGVLLSAVMMVLGMILLPLRSGGFSPQRVLAFPLYPPKSPLRIFRGDSPWFSPR